VARGEGGQEGEGFGEVTSLLLAISVALNGHWVTVGEPPADGVEVFVVIEWVNEGMPVKRRDQSGGWSAGSVVAVLDEVAAMNININLLGCVFCTGFGFGCLLLNGVVGAMICFAMAGLNMGYWLAKNT
jgi:hypothetical protein